jgi:16S rRNA (uracil1498-N3)-methyltransferase
VTGAPWFSSASEVDVARLWRVYDPQARGDVERVTISAAETHHVRRVLRLGPGDELAVFDGRGGEWRATLDGYDGSSAVLLLGEEIVLPVDPALDVRLYQSCARADRLDWIVQKGTEVGLAAIVAVGSERGAGESAGRRLDRLRRIAVEAAKQSGRRRVPDVEVADGLPDPAGDALALLLDPGASVPLAAACAGGAATHGAAWLAVGPEGGFSSAEVARATSAGWRAVRVGPRVLRTETAGLVAAAIVLDRLGDLGA